MIPYEDLVSALTVWRERNGLPTGASDYLGEPPAPEPVSFAAYESRPNAVIDDEVNLGEDWGAEPIEETPIEEWASDEQPIEEHRFSTDDLIAAHGDEIAADLSIEEAYNPDAPADDIWGPEDDLAMSDETYNEPIAEDPVESDEFPPLEVEPAEVEIEDTFDPPPAEGEATQIGVEPAPDDDDRDDFY